MCCNYCRGAVNRNRLGMDKMNNWPSLECLRELGTAWKMASTVKHPVTSANGNPYAHFCVNRLCWSVMFSAKTYTKDKTWSIISFQHLCVLVHRCGSLTVTGVDSSLLPYFMYLCKDIFAQNAAGNLAVNPFFFKNCPSCEIHVYSHCSVLWFEPSFCPFLYSASAEADRKREGGITCNRTRRQELNWQTLQFGLSAIMLKDVAC